MISDVSQFSLSDSRNEPFFSIRASTFVPYVAAVRFRASWNAWPPMEAFSIDIQSCRRTVPVASACDICCMA